MFVCLFFNLTWSFSSFPDILYFAGLSAGQKQVSTQGNHSMFDIEVLHSLKLWILSFGNEHLLLPLFFSFFFCLFFDQFGGLIIFGSTQEQVSNNFQRAFFGQSFHAGRFVEYFPKLTAVEENPCKWQIVSSSSKSDLFNIMFWVQGYIQTRPEFFFSGWNVVLDKKKLAGRIRILLLKWMPARKWKSLEVSGRTAPIRHAVEVSGRTAPIHHAVEVSGRTAQIRHAVEVSGRTAPIRHAVEVSGRTAPIRHALQKQSAL